MTPLTDLRWLNVMIPANWLEGMTKILTLCGILHYILFVAAGENLPSDCYGGVHQCVCYCIFAKDGLYLCQSCAPVLVFLRNTEESSRTWRASSELLVDVLRGGADACTPPLKVMNIWGVQQSTNYGRQHVSSWMQNTSGRWQDRG